jgi:hypothetical protein
MLWLAVVCGVRASDAANDTKDFSGRYIVGNSVQFTPAFAVQADLTRGQLAVGYKQV